MTTKTLSRRLLQTSVILVITLGFASCTMMGHYLKHGFVKAPAPSEFGLGPRASFGGAFTATIEPEAPLKVGKLQTVHVRITNAAGEPVGGARITIDGGMPQHGHGLPTRPRVTASDGDGMYTIEGLRFNMGGWWELRFGIASAGATDSVTFNVKL